MPPRDTHKFEISNIRFKTVLETATDSIIIADEDSTILYCNSKALQLFGYKEEELIGKELTALMPERYRKAHKSGVSRFISTGKPHIIGSTIEIHALKKNQKEFPVELSISAWQENDNYYFAGIIRDITEKRKLLMEMEILHTISTAISKADNFNNALSMTIKIICQEAKWDCGEAWVLNKSKHIVEYAPVWYMNEDKFLPFFESSEKLSFKVGEGLAGRVFLNQIEWHPDITDTEDFKRKEITEQVGLRSVLGVPIKTHEGEVFASLMFYYRETREKDISFTRLVTSLANQLGTFLEKKQAEERLKESRDFYLTILEDFPALIWRTDIGGKPVYYNKTWLKFTGNCFEDEINKDWSSHMPKEDLDKLASTFNNAVEERSTFEIKFRMKRHDGKYRWILNFGRPFFDIDNHFKGYLGVAYDITEQKNNQEKLNNLNAELENKVDERTSDINEKNKTLIKINRDLDNFIYTASHDLKAPIANMEGLATMLQNTISTPSKDNKDASALVGMMNDSISKLNNTIQDLTEISKVQRMGKDDIASQHLEEIIEDIKVLLSKQIKESNAIIKLNLKACPAITFSKKDMRSVVMNLMSNSIKFRSPKRRCEIEVNCYNKGDYSVLSISDNGIGIDLKNVKLFKMFKRYNTETEGAGIGLYILKRIMDDSGGKIEVESEPDHGSTFKVYFKK